MRRCRDTHELDDVVQETLLRAARYRARGGSPRRFTGWLSRIAINALHDWIRREGRERQMACGSPALEELAAPEVVCEATAAPSDEPYRLGVHVVTKDIAADELASVLRGMRASDRRLLQAFYGGRQSCREAAQICGLPVERTKVRLYRARRRLARELARRMSVLQTLRAGERSVC